jgi:hypothetical protein
MQYPQAPIDRRSSHIPLFASVLAAHERTPSFQFDREVDETANACSIAPHLESKSKD